MTALEAFLKGQVEELKARLEVTAARSARRKTECKRLNRTITLQAAVLRNLATENRHMSDTIRKLVDEKMKNWDYHHAKAAELFCRMPWWRRLIGP